MRYVMRKRMIFLLSIALALGASTIHGQNRTVFVNRGFLQDPATVGTGAAFKEVELADINDDQRPDLILPQKHAGVSQGPNNDIAYLSAGGDLILAVDNLAAKFAYRATDQVFIEPNPSQPLMTSRAYDVELADFDQDGALDLLRPDRFGRVDIWWGHKDAAGNPDGTFQSRTDVLADFGPNPNQGCGGGVDGNYDDVAIARLDGDSDLDFIVAQRQTCGGFQSTNVLVENRRSVSFPGDSSFVKRASCRPPARTRLASATSTPTAPLMSRWRNLGRSISTAVSPGHPSSSRTRRRP